MPNAKIGDKINVDRTEFLELKSKGDKVKIRIANSDYYYEGKHFMQKKNGDWVVSLCPRVNLEQECVYCEEYFELRDQLKDAKENSDSKLEDELDKKARKVKANLAFYYPALDRDSGLATIFKTSLMIRLGLEEAVDDGVDILGVDFIVKRTEKPGSYYTLSRVDSADTPILTQEEEEELEKARNIDVGKIIGGKKGSMSFVPDEPNGEAKEDDVDPNDVPF